MSASTLTLVSHHLCPYVQRAVISLTEKAIPFERVYIDLSDKPDWFLKISPLGKTPVLRVGSRAIFESNVILEYLEEIYPTPLHPSEPLERAEHRAWMEFGSAVLANIAAYYSAPDRSTFDDKARLLSDRFGELERHVSTGPYFSGDRFALVDAVFGPVFRYFDVFEKFSDDGILSDKPKITRWRRELASRPSVQHAVTDDYEDRLLAFLKNRKSHLSQLIAQQQSAHAAA